MRKLMTLFLISFLIFPLSTYAGIYGTLKGKVVDDEGKPVIGATVRVVGTPRGTYVKEKDGRFTVVNINSGEYQVQVTAVGYSKYTITIRISADETTEINVKLTSEIKKMGQVDVFGTRVMVNNTEIGTKRKITTEGITQVAREGVQNVVGLSAGVFQGGNGYNIRGSRQTETQIRVDGIDIGNQFTGGFGAAGLTYFPMISAFATEEIQVNTGAFAPEYGNALGGIVNTIGKVGRTDKYEGFIRWRTDVDALWGSQLSDLVLKDDGRKLTAIHTGEGNKLQGPQQHKFEFGAGGPIPILSNSTFYLSGYYLYEKYRNASFEIYNPLDVNHPERGQDNLGQLDNNRSWVKNLSVKTKWGISDDIYLLVGGMWGLTNLEVASSGWLYTRDQGIINGVGNGLPEYIAKLPVNNTLVMNIMARINHTLSDKSFYELTISNNTNADETSKRNLYPDYSVTDFINGRFPSEAEIKDPTIDPNFFTGFEMWYPYDKVKADQNTMIPGKNRIIDEFEVIPTIITTADGYLKGASRKINPITGYIEGDINDSGTDNPFGRDNTYATHGNTRSFEFRKSNYWQIEGNYSLNIEGEFSHMFKTGIDFRFYELHRHENNLPWVADPFFDVYTDQWEGNLYAEDQRTWDMTSKPYKPILGAVYLQDQISYKGIIISPGLRFDFFSPMSDYRTTNTDFISILSDSGFANSKLKFQISPRINVTYPITERSNVSIAYDMYFKIPEFQNLYDGFATPRLRGNQILGNPNMEAQRVNAYQVSYSNQLSDDFAFDLTAYYKDIYNQIGIMYVPAVPVSFFQYTVAEYGNAKGLEITFRKNTTATDNIGFFLNYTLSAVNGTSSSATDNYQMPIDPYTNLPAYPLSEYPMPWDRRHKINFNLTFDWRDNQGPSIAGIQPLENTNINFTTFFQTGAPYTKRDIKNNAVGEINAERGPSSWRTDMRLSKMFKFKDIFGEDFGETSVEFFVDVFNIFNIRSANNYYIVTGDPDDDGVYFYYTQGSFSSTTLYKEADFSNPDSFKPDQYDYFGNRKYNINSDFDGNGVVTQAEKFQAFKRQLEISRKFQGTYQTPITVYFGVMFRF
ncbi:MAG: hypothetical protein A2X61_16470 [Ignavibacteria bacterium GWB2_35_12]|nr:MAG: hypothetical protein A2X63_14255 [Ignavibacteria bacterium GWA2_35_8]OGU38124.1 MAG: hypothetical protein A2X61_16470 [Ignavibacteria bacterium GWB2_35_12]OGU87016.1 MAG: hypothetical protein A2220_05705 [Ignavibacteria bacterium RIFOXYA2_FULL_35_10]OGV24896.1 MAG: hypothetical protein A2475_16095 [Ignavibacteria bacterium RIFOXYC2_FULL_35_21]